MHNTNSPSYRKSYSTAIPPHIGATSPGGGYNPFNSFTSTKSFGNVFRLIPEGDDNHIRNAFYNVLAFICLTIIMGISVAVFFVLQKFLRPIAWALLFGAFLHPFKSKLTKFLYEWVDSIAVPQTRKAFNNRTFLFSLFYSPIIFSTKFIQKIGDNIILQWKYIVSLLGVIASIFVIYRLKIIQALIFIIKYLSSIFVYSFDFWLTLFSGPWTIALLIAFFVSILFINYDQTSLKMASYIVWLLIMCNMANYLTSNYQTQSLIFIILVGFYITGLFYDIKVNKRKQPKIKEVDVMESFDNLDITSEIKPRESKTAETLKEIKNIVVQETKAMKDETLAKSQESSYKKQGDKNGPVDVSDVAAWDSNRYIMVLFWCCMFIEFYKWVLLLLPLAIVIALVKRIGYHFGIWDLLYDKIYTTFSDCPALNDNVRKLRFAIINTPIKGIYQMFLTLDGLMIKTIRNSIDSATTILLLLFTFITLITLGVFLSFQIYQESAHIVNIAHSALNSTIVENQWFQPSEEMGKSVDTVLEKGYQAGREWIASQFTAYNKPNNKDLSRLEAQVLNLWDNIYENVVKKGPSHYLGDDNTSSASKAALSAHKRNILLHNWHNIVESVTQVGTAHRDGIVKFVKENIDTFNSVLSTVWVIIKSNISIVIALLSNIWGFLFGGGTALLNFFLSWIIFLSTLIYFLSSSGEQYKPVQWFTQFMPNDSDSTEEKLSTSSGKTASSHTTATNSKGPTISTATHVPPKIHLQKSAVSEGEIGGDKGSFDLSLDSSHFGDNKTYNANRPTFNKESSPPAHTNGANKIALAIQEAISGVFAATLKMACFYGLYTWLTHKVFGVGMVYIPTALAAIFAAVPFVGTYVAAIPATLELWIITGNFIIPLIFFFLHFVPRFFVDATIYQEIKGGGHPYFTGLSIVGGIYVFGLEGALIGPMLLCCLLAGLKVFGAYMHEE